MRKHFLLLALTAIVCCSSFAQTDNENNSTGNKSLFKRIKDSKAVSGVLEGKKPITTNFRDDVDVEGVLPPSFGEGKSYANLHSMPQSSEGAYLLKPGFYEVTNLSYCLKAGTHGPSRGDAYGLAPVKGKMDDIVLAILQRSQEIWRNKQAMDIGQVQDRDNRANIAEAVMNLTQRDVQVLLWAIIAKADFENMAGRTKAVALALLTPQQLVKLNGGAVKTVTNFASDKGFLSKPAWMQRMEQAEQSIRQLYASGTGTYEDFERLAVLAGLANEPQPVEAGTWFRHKDGYYVRFEPMGYPRTTTKVYVPDGVNVAFKATGMIATPSDSRQRLAQTDISVEEYQQLGLK